MLSFTITRTSIAFWWAKLWRAFVWMLILVIPYSLAEMLLGLFLKLTQVMFQQFSPALAAMVLGLSFMLGILMKFIIFPVIVQGFAFWRMFKKGRFGSHSISGVYEGKQATTLGTSMGVSAWFFVEILKYTWPFYIADILWLWVFIHQNSPQFLASTLVWSLPLLPLAIYNQCLIYTDILHRRTFRHFQLNVDKRDA